MRRPSFNGVLEAFPLLRTRHLRAVDDDLVDAGFEAYHVGPPHRVEIEKAGKPYAVIQVKLLPFVGGVRPLLICPRCGGRRGVLVLHPSGIGCRGRGCLNLTWRSTRQTSQERRQLRREYLEELLLDEDGDLCRPHRMRLKVYEALVEELFELETWG